MKRIDRPLCTADLGTNRDASDVPAAEQDERTGTIVALRRIDHLSLNA